MVADSLPQWAVVVARHGAELLAAERLREAGFRTYLPLMRVVLSGHRHGARGQVVLRPMIPPYLFAELHPGQWIDPGPRDLWRQWYKPWDRERGFVSDEAIELLRESEAREGEVVAAAKLPRSEIGAAVSADVGGVRIDGIVRKLSGSDRLIIESLHGMRLDISEKDVIRA